MKKTFRPLWILIMFAIIAFIDVSILIIIEYTVFKVIMGISVLALVAGLILFFFSGIIFREDKIIFKCLVASDTVKYNASTFKKLVLDISEIKNIEYEIIEMKKREYPIITITLNDRNARLEISLHYFSRKQQIKIQETFRNIKLK